MFGKNWKTSLTGLGMVLAPLSDIVHGLTTNGATIQWQLDVTGIIGGVGLLFAKDGNVTGGSVMQPTPPATLIAKANEQTDAGLTH
jgi:hypothetical protein